MQDEIKIAIEENVTQVESDHISNDNFENDLAVDILKQLLNKDILKEPLGNLRAEIMRSQHSKRVDIIKLIEQIEYLLDKEEDNVEELMKKLEQVHSKFTIVARL